MSFTVETVTAFFGWCAVINSAALTLMTLAMYLGKRWIPGIHAKLFTLPEVSVKAEHFAFLANYKLLILAFNIVPYIALKLLH